MFKKKSFAVVALGLLLTLSGCGPTTATTESGSDTDPAGGVTITYKVGEEVVHTEKVEPGVVPADYDYQPDEGVLVDWYLTPSFSRIYRFDEGFEEDTTLFGAVSVYEADTREYYLAGSGTSPLMAKSSWGDYIDDDLKLVKQDVADANVYKLQADFFEGDQFQVTSFIETEGDPMAWDWSFGYGYIINAPEMLDYLTGAGGLAASNRFANIEVLQDGKYELTLTTYPDLDPENPANKDEKLNNVSNLKIVRTGDATTERPELTYSYYIKGAGITDWKDLFNSYTRMAVDPDTGNHTLSIYLKAGEEFLFTSRTTDAEGKEATGSVYIKYAQLTADSKQYFEEAASDGSNLKTLAAGTYNFTYTPGPDNAVGTLAVTYDAEGTMRKGQYIINGTLEGATAGDWSTSMVHKDNVLRDDYKMKAGDAEDIYVIEDLKFRVNDEFSIACFLEGATEVGEGWGNQFASLNYTFASPATDADVWTAANPAGSNYNFKCLVEGTYSITLNAYSRIITIA